VAGSIPRTCRRLRRRDLSWRLPEPLRFSLACPAMFKSRAAALSAALQLSLSLRRVALLRGRCAFPPDAVSIQRISPVAVSARSSTSLSQRWRAGISTAVPLPRLLPALAAAEIAWRVQPALRHRPCRGSGHTSEMPGKVMVSAEI